MRLVVVCGGRDLFDKGSVNQKLSHEDIEALKAKHTPEEVAEILAENSRTFAGKTKFSQQKYLKKKRKRFCQDLRFLRPSVQTVADTYMLKDPMKILYESCTFETPPHTFL